MPKISPLSWELPVCVTHILQQWLLAAVFIDCNLMATADWSQVAIWSMLGQLPSLRICNWDKEIPSLAANSRHFHCSNSWF